MVKITDMKKIAISVFFGVVAALIIQKYAQSYSNIFLVIACIVLICVFMGVVYDNIWGIYRTKRTITPQKAYEMYNSKIMTESKIKLTEWWKTHSIDEYEKQINLPEKERDPSFKGIDETRRYISDCFRYIFETCSKKEIKLFVYASDIALLIDIVWPMELKIGIKLNKRPDRKRFQFFGELYEKELEWYRQTIKAI